MKRDRTFKRSRWVFGMLSLACLAFWGAYGERMEGRLHRNTIELMEENDGMFSEDRYYTQGFRFAYLRGESYPSDGGFGFLDKLTLDHFRNEEKAVGFVLGQNIYTPDDLESSSVIFDDRPYAGLLYSGLIYQKVGRTRGGLPVQDHYQLSLGIIGPQSFAEHVQKYAHEISNSSKPRGWDNQLVNEPGLALLFERRYRVSMEPGDGRWRMDLLPHAGMSLGNISTSMDLGLGFRFGYNIPRDFGVSNVHSISTRSGAVSTKLQDSGRPGVYFFGDAGTRLVAYNAALDGNLFSRSHSVEKEPFVPELNFGAVLAHRRFELGFQFIVTGQEFVYQRDWHKIGSLVLSLHF